MQSFIANYYRNWQKKHAQKKAEELEKRIQYLTEAYKRIDTTNNHDKHMVGVVLSNKIYEYAQENNMGREDAAPIAIKKIAERIKMTSDRGVFSAIIGIEL